MPRLLLLIVALLCASPVSAQTALELPDHWSGEGAFNASLTTGNTDDTDFGLDLKAKHTGGLWIQSMEFSGDYGDDDDVLTERDLTATAHVERILTPRWSAFLRGWWENDEFSGFGDRYFIGPGATYKVFDETKLKWAVDMGAGYKVDEVNASATAPARTVEELGLRAASRFRYRFNDHVTLTNDTVTLVSDEFTLFVNIIAVTASLANRFSLRASYDAHYDLNPPAGFANIETTTKISLVYKVE